jgi:hypothetical protein
MITCPLCAEEIRPLEETIARKRGMGFDPDNPNYECPTMVSLFKGHSSTHFSKINYGLYDSPRHYLIVGPFEITWFPHSKQMTIFDNRRHNDHFINEAIFKEIDNVEWAEVLQWAERLKKLRAFL